MLKSSENSSNHSLIKLAVNSNRLQDKKKKLVKNLLKKLIILYCLIALTLPLRSKVRILALYIYAASISAIGRIILAK